MHRAAPLAVETPRAPSADLGLYGVLALVWGTSWIALHLQLGVVSPEVSLVWRFALAAAIAFGLALARRETLRFPLRRHAGFLLAGVLMYSTNFVLFYHAGARVPSGLLAVVFALASPINLALGALIFRRPAEMRVLAGAALGVAGVGLLYAPEIAAAGFDVEALTGLGLSVGGTLCFCLGNMVSSVIQRSAPDVSAAAWGMFYGTLWLTLLATLSGAPFVIEPTAAYLVSLVWLAAGSSVAAFLAYLALIKRVGAARAGFATVLFPVVALVISSLFEDYRWTALSFAGAALVAAGNVVALRRRG
ncbi:multidrug DMT transporter permease [Methylopila jiangsuensis]|uniref:Multidrug DMT transporter permease n=1 Tax=Methylopila jiangsuensis TaxID=586230 RepID=A0A9W6N4E2_9HYPH|nr:DMT family transporter [Methylopila jiangsuensis]MDR6286430.1 drug/metabolite transporter (DMT)-like permease [Methylopila jiangsuensis]GLK77233.1 multidrug DMT transporter permease [Methylopila jiangsuensis]